ncbi:hypothetical protein [Marinobacterium litorale]|uniref:hypothetical protein n=1 Tax=Marinobacterium litorale TaxID=404770 RepID=UPI0003F6395B|nr:hypothetical protein [Marinobacterium litorale]
MNHPTEQTFLSSVENHSMEVHQDSGLFRHLTFSNNGSFNQMFHITTWPGHLCISGDMGCYVFSRIDDMFQFFRSGDELAINPGYWAEKVQAESVFGGGVKEWDELAAADAVQHHFDEWLEANADEPIAESEAMDELHDMVDRLKSLAAEETEFIAAVNNWDSEYAYGFGLVDFWEHRMEKYTYHYIWCCYAIAWAIQQYDRSKEAAAA